MQTPDYLTGCDGDRPWELFEDGEDEAGDGDGRSVQWISGPEPPLRSLLCPAWLLKSYRLEVSGHVNVLGRDALQVVATKEQGLRGAMAPDQFRAGGAEVLVDAELGILLRLARISGDEADGSAAEGSGAEGSGAEGSGADGGEADGSEAPEVIELVSLDLNPLIDPDQFLPPPGSVIGKRLGESFSGGGLAWQAVKTTAGLAAGGLAAWIRYSPFGHGHSPDTVAEASIPHDDPAPELPPDGGPAAPQIGGEILRLLHGSGAARFSATLYQWLDVGAMLSQIPPAARRGRLRRAGPAG